MRLPSNCCVSDQTGAPSVIQKATSVTRDREKREHTMLMITYGFRGKFVTIVSMTSGERERYSRQILFSEIGERGQERLLRSHAAIVGCGALGSLQAMALARAGVGRLSIIDRDYVDSSNLQRQFLFEESDAVEALPKAAAAERRLRRMNSTIEIRGIIADLNPSNVEELLDGVDCILDGTDNFETRYLLNDFAVCRGIPWIYGAAVSSYGLTMPVISERTACLRCISSEPPAGAQPTFDTAGGLDSL